MTKQPRLECLDGMRGVCAIALMLYHIYSWQGVDYFQIGYFGVYVFFVLSGFSLWYVYATRTLNIELVRQFFVARFARIVPLYFAVCLLAVVARIYAQGAESVENMTFFGRFLLNVTLLFGVNTPGVTSIVPGGWSIGVEAVFYLFFPLFLIFMRRMPVMVMMLLLGFILNQVLVSSVIATHGSILSIPGWSAYTHFTSFLVYFFAGILTAEVYLQAKKKAKFANISPWLCRLGVIFGLAVIFLYPAASPEEYLSGLHVALLIAAVMGAVFFGSLLRTPYKVERAVYKFLGDVSYSTYLLNFFVSNAVLLLLTHIYPDHSFAVYGAITVVCTLTLAFASYKYFESPARQWITKRFSKA